ncbi:MAG: hypothetical protein PVH41_09615 [Anaerolineae bacterium]|jgi:3-oxoacyl-[acyl-carrier-protein] synthase II
MINLHNPDPESALGHVPERARQIEGRVTLSNSFGLGGQNARAALGRF